MSKNGSQTAPTEALRDALAAEPSARVSAVSADGTPVDVPAEVPLGEEHVRAGTAGMMAYHPQDRPLLISGFDRALRDGWAQLTVRLVGAATTTAVNVEMFDVLEDCGVVVIVAVPSVGDSPATQTSLLSQQSLPSRLARMHKTRTAEIVDIDGGVTDILGWSAADMIGHRSLEYLHPDDHDLAIQAWAMLLSDPSAAPRVRVRHQGVDGRWIWFDISHSACAAHSPDCFIADMIDISKEMEAREALAAREQMLTQLARALPLGIFQIDRDRRLVYVNEGLGEVMGVDNLDDDGDVTGLLRWLTAEDRRVFLSSLHAVSSAEGTREFDVRLVPPGHEAPVVCRVTMRGLEVGQGGSGGAVGCVADVTEHTQLRQALEDRATFDSLTRCLNRESAMTALDTALRRRLHGARTPAVMFIDLDKFKTVNDRHGHAVGDELLVAVAAEIRANVRDGDVVGRIGGDEFLVVLDGISASEADQAVKRLRRALEREFVLSVGPVAACASVGLARADSSSLDADALVTLADAAMYAAKRSGITSTTATPTTARGPVSTSS
ncbi:MAG TPA: diguanylate cyclase [Mycobacteriales bacterium]|nr:diguanylate cyclase [Mycobacteriales bacterium]